MPSGFTPYSATFVSGDDGWVLGDAPCSHPPCTSVVRTTDGGASWRGIPAPKAPIAQRGDERSGVTMLRFANSRDGWAAGLRLYATHDGGASWKQATRGLGLVGSGSQIVTALETGGGSVFATVYGCPSQGGNHCAQTVTVYAAAIGSDSWSQVSPTMAGGGVLTSLVVNGADWFLALPSGVYHGHGRAMPFRRANPCLRSGQTGAPAPTIAVADATHLDALCVGGGAGGSAPYQLYGTTDGAQRWAKAGPSRRESSGLYGLADNAHGVLLAAVASGGSEILRSTDDGTTLPSASITTPTGGDGWSDLGFTTQSQAVVILNGKIMYLSRDAGRNWKPVRF